MVPPAPAAKVTELVLLFQKYCWAKRPISPAHVEELMFATVGSVSVIAEVVLMAMPNPVAQNVEVAIVWVAEKLVVPPPCDIEPRTAGEVEA